MQPNSLDYFYGPFKELNQRMNFMMNIVMSNDWNSQQASNKDLKSNARSNRRTSDEESHEFLELLKKTQAKVNTLENEFENVEAENIHQDQGSETIIKISDRIDMLHFSTPK